MEQYPYTDRLMQTFGQTYGMSCAISWQHLYKQTAATVVGHNGQVGGVKRPETWFLSDRQSSALVCVCVCVCLFAFPFAVYICDPIYGWGPAKSAMLPSVRLICHLFCGILS